MCMLTRGSREGRGDEDPTKNENDLGLLPCDLQKALESGRSNAPVCVVDRGIIWVFQFILVMRTYHLKCHRVCLSVILLCYSLRFSNKKKKGGGRYLCQTLYSFETNQY